MEIEKIAYVDYSDHIQIDLDMIIVAAWNKYIIFNGGDNKISINDNGFFEKSFKNAYDAAWAVFSSGKWKWSDSFVYFDSEGILTSFSHWDDGNSPIDIDKIDINHLINSLKRCHK